jgi:hypothetical protein
VQVNAAFADADLAGEIIDGHLLITVSRKESVRGVEDLVADISCSNCVSHRDL